MRKLRELAVLAPLASVLALLPLSAEAQTYPTGPVEIIVPYPPGGGTDVLARVLAKALSDRLGERVYVENRAGGDATIGAEAVAKAKPDGYTLLIVSGVPFVINQTVYSNLQYDTVEDFEAVSLFAQWPLVLLTNPSVPAESVEEFVAHLEDNPGTLNYAGSDQMTFIGMEMIKQGTGTDMVHVAYKGVGPSITDLLGGHVSAMLSSIGPAIPHIESGNLNALAVTGTARSSSLPDVPTLAETILPDYEINAWYGLFAPAGTPDEIVDRLNEEVAKAVESPEVKEHFASLGAETINLSPEEFAQFVAAERDKWSAAVKTSGVPIQ